MQDREKKQYHNIIPIGNAFATLACGFSARLIVHFEQMPKRPPKHAVALLLYLCNWTQRNNLYNENKNETIGVSLSVRELATQIGAKNSMAAPYIIVVCICLFMIAGYLIIIFFPFTIYTPFGNPSGESPAYCPPMVYILRAVLPDAASTSLIDVSSAS